ncbi:MAG: hypothetical protein IKP98_00215 [Bacilli bacterium]|nr:hypothetical protein [Bacilli bacterium]
MEDFMELLQKLMQYGGSQLIIGLFILPPLYIVDLRLRKKISSSKYALRRDYKNKKIKTVNLPPEVIESAVSIDEKEILKKQYGEYILEFNKILTSTFPEEYLRNYFRNINTVKVQNFNYVRDKIICNTTKIDGQYRGIENSILLKKDLKDLRKTIFHELLHMASSFYDSKNKIGYSGFHQTDRKRRQSIGAGLNEGYTEYIRIKRFYDNDITNVSYIYETKIARKIDRLIGSTKMEELYFKADLHGLIEALKEYASVEEIHDFIIKLDLYNTYPSNKGTIKDKINIMNDIDSFLFKAFFRKNMKELDKPAEFNDINRIIEKVEREMLHYGLTDDKDYIRDINYDLMSLSINTCLKEMGYTQWLMEKVPEEKQR